MSSVNVVFFNIGNSVPALDELERFYSNNPKYEVSRISNPAEVIQFMSSTNGGILLFKVAAKVDLQQGVMILKSMKKLAKQGLFKSACFSGIKNKKVETILAKNGCIDILEPDIKAKTLSFKMDFWYKPIFAQLQKIEKQEQLQADKLEQQKSTTTAKAKKEDFELVKALDLQSDFWLVKAKADYKKILRRYLVRLLGPSPFIGNWVELDSQPGEKQPTWKFVLKDSGNTDYIVDDGAWFFSGAKPEFDWKIQRWNFPSEFPHLYFCTRDGDVFSKVKYQAGHVLIAENSEFAKMREEMILETCNSEFNIEGDEAEGDTSENLEGDADSDNLGGNLEGKGSEADQLNGNLEGKGSAADELGGDPLEGKGGEADRYDPLSGKGSAADHLSDLDNSGKKNTAGMFPEDENDNASKNKTDHIQNDPLSGKGSAADQSNNLDNGDKKNTAGMFSEDEKDNSSKNQTEHMGSGPLSGKGSAADQSNNLDNGDKKNTAGMFPEDEKDNSSKNQTEHMGSGPLSGKGSAADQSNNLDNGDKKNTAGMFPEDEKDNSSKNQTEHMGSGPLSGKGSAADQSNNLDNGDKKNTAGMFPEDEKDNSSKNQTEHMGSGPLSGKGSAADQSNNPDNGDKKNTAGMFPEDEKDNSSKNQTEHMGGDPLGGKGSAADRDNDLSNDGKKYGTDHMGGDPLGGKGSAADRDKDLSNDGKKYGTDHMGGDPLGGKGSAADRDKDLSNDGKKYGTDHMGGGPLGGKGSPADRDKNLDNKGKHYNTDHLGGGPLGGRTAQEEQEARNDAVDALMDELPKHGLTPEDVPLLPNGAIDVDQPVGANIAAALADLGVNPDDVKMNQDGSVKEVENEPAQDELSSEQQQAVFAALAQLDKEGIKPEDVQLNEDGTLKNSNEKLQALVDDLKNQGVDLNDLPRTEEGFIPSLARESQRREREADGYDPREDQLRNNHDAHQEANADYLDDLRKRKEALRREAENDSADYLQKHKDEKEAKRQRDLEAEQKIQEREAIEDEIRKGSANGIRDIDAGPGSSSQRGRREGLESDMLDALGGGLTKNAGRSTDLSDEEDSLADRVNASNVIIDNKNGPEEKPKLTGMITGESSLNLESGELKVILKQATSAGNAITFLCEFEDFYEDELITIAPKNSMQVGTEVTGEVTLIYSGKKVKVACKGVIEEIEDYSDSKDTVCVALKEIESEKYETFLKLYSDRQSSINDFMEKAKGY